MNCGRSSSVEWKLPKLQRRVRFPSPAPPPARPRAGRFCYGRAGCARTTGSGAAISARGKAGAQRLHVVQTPTTSGMEGARRLRDRAQCRLARESSPSRGLAVAHPRKKLAQQGQKHRIWGVLSTQGEVFRAFALKQCRRANFFAPGTATTRNLNIQGHDDALTLST